MVPRRTPPAGFGEASLFDLSGWLLSTAKIIDFIDGGVLVAELPADKAETVPDGRPLRFQLALGVDEVRGMAEVVGVEARALRLRLLEIDNEGGLPRLLAFLHGWLLGG